jgi:hypothetical protein
MSIEVDSEVKDLTPSAHTASQTAESAEWETVEVAESAAESAPRAATASPLLSMTPFEIMHAQVWVRLDVSLQ